MIQQALLRIALDVITAGLFFLFAVLLVRSAPDRSDTLGTPETDGGVVGASLPEIGQEFEVHGYTIDGWFGQFCSIVTLMAAGEFGDKTQLITIGLAVQYGAIPAIWLGEMIVIISVSLANVYLFHRFSHRFNVRTAHYVGAALFAFFGTDTALMITTEISVWKSIVSMISDVVLTVV